MYKETQSTKTKTVFGTGTILGTLKWNNTRYRHLSVWAASLPFFGLILLMAGCTVPRPLKPGTARMHSGVATNGSPEFVSEMKQPENPAQSATQNFERTTETELPLARGTRVTEKGTGAKNGVERTIVLIEPTVQRTRVTEKAGTVLGAAQRDTAREVGAKLASLKGIVWVGVGLFVFGIASLAWPPLRVIIGSVTTSVAILLGGVALMVLPTLIVGNELLILGGVTLLVGAWFLAHRHGQLRGAVEAERGKERLRVES